MLDILSIVLGTFHVKSVVQNQYLNQELCAHVCQGFTEFRGKKQIVLPHVMVNNI